MMRKTSKTKHGKTIIAKAITKITIIDNNILNDFFIISID